ncbi:MAG: hypothetical protein HY908_25800 [Myxococcales bacterium]|nr:hypothetical protein [Myxococcales bacterium]
MTLSAHDRPSDPAPASEGASRHHILARRATFVSAALAGGGLGGAGGACVCLSVEPAGDRHDAGTTAPDAGTPAATSPATATAPAGTGTAPGTGSAVVGAADAGTPVPTASTTSTATPPLPPPRVCLSLPMPKPPKKM